MSKSPDAFRTIGEVAELLDVPAHVLRFWESRFTQIRPVKRAGGRRYYRPTDVALLSGIRTLLHDQGMTIRGVQKLLRDEGVRHICALAAHELAGDAAAELEEDTVAIVPRAPVERADKVIPWPGPRESPAAEAEMIPEDSAVTIEPEAPDLAATTGKAVTGILDPEPPLDVVPAPEPVEVAVAPPPPPPLDDLPLFGGWRAPEPAAPAVAPVAAEQPVVPPTLAELPPQGPGLAPRVLVVRLLLLPPGAIAPERGAPVLAGLRALRQQLAGGRVSG